MTRARGSGPSEGSANPTGLSPLDRSSSPDFTDFTSTPCPFLGHLGPVAGGMCVVFLYVRTPKRPGEEAIDCPYAAVVAVNRDESYTRDTARLHWWPQDATADPRECARDWQILAGRDREGGGTWCGVSRDGRVAVLTNVAEASAKFATGKRRAGASYRWRSWRRVGTFQICAHPSNRSSPSTLPPAPEPSIHRPSSQEKHPRRPPARWLADVARTAPRTTASTSSSATPGQASSRTSPTAATTRRSSPGWTRRTDAVRVGVRARTQQRGFEHPVAEGASGVRTNASRDGTRRG